MDEKNAATGTVKMGSVGTQKGILPGEQANIIQLIVFNLGDEEFGANIDQVREIIRIAPITPIPDSPDFVKGITNVRGEIAVVIDLKRRFFLPAKEQVEEKHIVITEQEKNLFGLMVDEVAEVLRISEGEVKPTPELVTRIDRIYISGVLTLENRLIMLLDLAKVLSEEELAKLSELRLKQRATVEKSATAESAEKEQRAQKKTATAEGAEESQEAATAENAEMTQRTQRKTATAKTAEKEQRAQRKSSKSRKKSATAEIAEKDTER